MRILGSVSCKLLHPFTGDLEGIVEVADHAQLASVLQ